VANVSLPRFDGTLTGLGGNLIIIDDPLKLGEAMSEAARGRVIEWFRSTLITRGDDKAATRIVLVMQRVHQDDLAGYLLDQGDFEILNLPQSRSAPKLSSWAAVALTPGKKESCFIPTMSPLMFLPSSSAIWAQSHFRPNINKTRYRLLATSSSVSG
jgi:hypothetical protein